MGGRWLATARQRAFRSAAPWRFRWAWPPFFQVRIPLDRSGWGCGIVRPGVLMRTGILPCFASARNEAPHAYNTGPPDAVAITYRLAPPALQSVGGRRPQRSGSVRGLVPGTVRLLYPGSVRRRWWAAPAFSQRA